MEMEWIDLALLWIKDAWLRSLIEQVWLRLPASDQHVLEDRLLDITVHDVGIDDTDQPLASVWNPDPDGTINGWQAGVAENLHPVVDLSRAKNIASDEVCIFVIAHEFAHVVLRHNEMALVVENLTRFKGEPYYTDDDMDSLKQWQEEEANLQAWLWGFKEEMRAFYELYPSAPRPRWDVWIEWEQHGTRHKEQASGHTTPR